jgi:D-alanyl-D-alanine carboxypeptidase
MPVAGQSGTLADRLENSPANGYVRAKTGTVFGSYQIAGYIPYMQGTSTVLAYVPFVILTNMHEKGATEARDKANAHAKQDEIIDYMFRKMNPHIPPPSPQK